MMTPSLALLVEQKQHNELLEVIVEFSPPEMGPAVEVRKPRGERLEAREKLFDQLSAPVRELIEGLGGKVLKSASINHTLKASLPVGKLAVLDQAEGVRKLDSSRSLKQETGG